MKSVRMARIKEREGPRQNAPSLVALAGISVTSFPSLSPETTGFFYRTLLEAANDLLIVLDTHAIIRDVVQMNGLHLGYSAEELLGHCYLEFVHPDDVGKSSFVEEHARSGHEVTGFVNRYIAKDGTIRWLEWNAVRVGDEVHGTARDITEQKAAEVRLQVLKRALHALSQSNQVMVRAADEEELLAEMCRIVVEIGGYGLAWVGMVENDDPLTVRRVARAGEAVHLFDGPTLQWGEDDLHLPGPRALATGRSQVVPDILSAEVRLPRGPEFSRLGLRSMIALPLSDRDRVFGMLAIYSKETEAFGKEEVALLEELAMDLAYGLTALRAENERRQAVQDRLRAEEELRRSVEQLERALEGTVQALASALESRDSYTAGHMRRVADLAHAIAVEMGLPADQVRGIFWGATLHDIGKIQVPAEILSKPTKLSVVEMAIIRTHPEAGYQILKNVEFPWPIAQMVLQHHERLDGRGYPRGLSEGEILPEARILAVADVLEAGTSRRPYRPQGDEEKIWSDLTESGAAAFDQVVVTAARAVWPQMRARWAEQQAVELDDLCLNAELTDIT